MIKKLAWLMLAGSVVVLALITLTSQHRLREPAAQPPGVDAGQAAVKRVLDRTLRESRAGVEFPAVIAPPTVPAPPQSISVQPPAPGDDSQGAAERTGAAPVLAPEGYSLGTYRGLMQRAPSSGNAEPELSPNPYWLDPASAPGSILGQSRASGREFAFAVLRPDRGTNAAEFNRALAAHDAIIDGSSGEYLRMRLPAERGRIEAIAALDGVLGLGALPAAQKAPEAFVEEMRSRAAGELVPVYITLMSEDPAGEWRRALSGLGIVAGAWDSDLRSYTANMPASALTSALAADYVMAIEPVPAVTANHASSVPVMGADELREYVPGEERFTGLTGEGIAVAVFDTGLNASHMDIVHGRESVCGANFVVGEQWDLWVDMDGHGTHVFGTVAGAGATDPLLAGVAPGVRHLRFGKVLSARGSGSGEDIRRAMDYFSRPTSCAWRGAIPDAVKPLIVNMSLAASALSFSGRGVDERKLDAVVNAQSQLYVVAQSNEGLHGFSNYGTAKNSLAVGAVRDSGLIAGFSSHGPTADGRLAPNLVGTGVNLTSARGQASLSGHDTFSGTSMASPSVAGVAALLMQSRPEFQNRPALARARLMASAIRPEAYFGSGKQLPTDNSGGPGGFNNLYGMGLVSARTAVFQDNNAGGWLNGSASAEPVDGAYEYIDIDVPEGASRLDVVLTWDEQPADTLTRSVLNNLDLWADRGADCGAGACGEHASRSEVDNVEWLLIEDPAPGTYRIKVAPVEIYGESVAAAVAWTIRRGDATPRLDVQVEEASTANAGSRYLVLDVTVESSSYVASGTTVHLGCRAAGEEPCAKLFDAFLPHRSRVFRGDGQNRPLQHGNNDLSSPISVGEVAAGSPRRLQLWFLRERVPSGATLYVTASSWNAFAGGRSIGLAAVGVNSAAAPPNDNFSAPERLSGATGETRLDLALASREPGEPRVSSGSRTLWYEWEAPAGKLFRFRVKEADSGRPATVDFALFTGDALVDLKRTAEKRGSEISFNAQADARMRLQIASGVSTWESGKDWDLPQLALQWEPADVRPANDDFGFAEAIRGESGSISSTNEGATLERSEFWGGLTATVWYEWTAPADGFAEFRVDADELTILAFRGGGIGDLRLGAQSDALVTPIRTSFSVRRGETWRIALASEDADATGLPFTLSWDIQDTDPLAYRRHNDSFADAVRIDGDEGAVRNLLHHGNVPADYTVEASEPPETGIATGWWQWTAPRNGRFTWRMDGSTAYRLAFFTGDALNELRWVSTLTGGSTLVLDAVADTRYSVAFGRASNEVGTDPGQPTVFGWGPSPANDDRARASAMTGTAGTVSASLVHATAEAAEPRSSVGLDSVWWNWRAPATGWYRLSVEGNPLHATVQVFPGDGSGAASQRDLGDTERSFLANGRVDMHVFVRAGERYDIRLSRRPGVKPPGSDTLVWAPSDPPAYLSYKGAVTEASLMSNILFGDFWLPRHLAAADDGIHLFSMAGEQAGERIYAFVRDGESGELALKYRAGAEEIRDAGGPQNANLSEHIPWWSPRHEKLFAVSFCGASYSFALPGAGSALDVRQFARVSLPGDVACGDSAAVGDRDGRHLYATESYGRRLVVIQADSPSSLTHVQTVSGGPSGDGRTVVPGINHPLDLALAPDGRHLYLVDEFGLFVFSRNVSSGRLALAAEIPFSNDPGTPFQKMHSLRHAAIDAGGTVLFVAGYHLESSVTNAAIAAFDISTDPSNPAHLDTLTGFHFHQADGAALDAWNLLQPRPQTFRFCDKPMAHGRLPAVDLFCSDGYFVVQWDSEANVLEVTDFAVSGQRDRLGNPVPVLGYRPRRMAQDPDGAHVYRTTHWQDQGQPSAIHVFERAAAFSAESQTAPPSGVSVTVTGN